MKRKPYLSELERKEMAFIPLISLIARRKTYKLKTAAKIMNCSEEKLDLILAGEYDRLEVDEMITMTAKLIFYYFRKSRVNERR